jgi:cobalt-zinc-cadmium efflux system outer membrane protein
MRRYRLLLFAIATSLAANPAQALEASGPAGLSRSDLEPTGSVTLARALDAALERNPELVAAGAEVAIGDARAVQVGLWPNPEISTEIEDVAGSGSYGGWDSGQTTISLAQLIELGGKRSKRRRVAELERDLVAWDYQARRLDLLGQVAQAFVRTLAAQERRSLADDFLRIASESARTVSTSVRTGAVSRVEETRALATLSRANAERVASENSLAAARIALATTWGSADPRFDAVTGDLAQLEPIAPLEKLIAMLEANPDLARWEAERAQRRAALALEKARRLPDVTLAAGGRQYAETGDGAAVFSFAVPLPLFDRNQGNILAAERAASQAVERERAARVAAVAAIRSDHAALTTALRQATELRENAIPQARQTHEGALAAYARGLFRYLEVLDAQRTLYELRAEYIDVLEQYHFAAVAIDRLTGIAAATSTAKEASDTE